MAKNDLFSQKKAANAARIQRTDAYAEQVRREFAKCVNEILALNKTVPTLDEGVMFSFDGASQRTQDQVERLLRRLHSVVVTAIEKGVSLEWGEAEEENNKLVESLFGKKVLSNPRFKAMTEHNQAALDAFAKRTEKGMDLSARIWKNVRQLREEMEVAMTVAIGEGESAANMSRKVRQYLNDPDLMFRKFRYKKSEKEVDDYDENGKKIGSHTEIEWGKKWKKKVKDEKTGKVKWVDYDKDSYKTGPGVYKSSAKNAMRVTRSETNIAYRRADHERWNALDFVLGQRIELSKQHPKEDVCDEFAGEYPKEFVFDGWHPQCYAEDMSVLTNDGWKLFEDVKSDNLILSLNPNTMETEWARITEMQSWQKDGKMVRFSNKNLDCLVTPEHRMVYLSKAKNEITYTLAADYRQTQGAFYRGSANNKNDRETIEIGGVQYDFDWFCEFMGYWLACGSTIRSAQITIAQKDGETAKARIIACLERYFKVTSRECCIDFYNTPVCSYLKKFGLYYEKYVPEEIMNASVRQIRIFLNAFNRCDGSIRMPKAFIGSGGNECKPTEPERMYFTTSDRMAGNLCELLIKVGHRPSYSLQEPSISIKNDGEIIHSNLPCYRIRECESVTSTAFKKEWVDYCGMVYDLTLDRNHIMYVSRNGKCFWGSNCFCIVTPILAPEEEMSKSAKAALKGEIYFPKGNKIKDYPEGFKQWVKDNKKNLQASRDRGTEPYFYRNNADIVEGLMNPKEKLSPLEIAKRRHDARTPEQIDAIKRKWEERRNTNKKQSGYVRFDAKTIDEAKQFISDRIADNITLDIKKTDLSLINDIMNQLAQRMEEFGISKFAGLGKPRNSKADASWDETLNVFNVNLSRLRAGKQWDINQKYVEKFGYEWSHYADKDDIVRATIDHELGHVLLQKYQLERDATMARGKAGVSKNGFNELLQTIGFYADTDDHEYFAEAFSIYMGKDRGRIVGCTKELMEKLMSKVRSEASIGLMESQSLLDKDDIKDIQSGFKQLKQNIVLKESVRSAAKKRHNARGEGYREHLMAKLQK